MVRKERPIKLEPAVYAFFRPDTAYGRVSGKYFDVRKAILQ